MPLTSTQYASTTLYYESAKHPYGNVVIRPFTIRSASYGGSTTLTIGIDDLVIPASPNFPSSWSGTSTSYMIETDWALYYTSTNSTAWVAKNVTQGKTLTIVDEGTGLSNYTIKVFSTASERQNTIEAHVGSTSNVAGDIFAITGFASATMIKQDRGNLLTAFLTTSALSITNGIAMTKRSTSAVETYAKRLIKKLDIGDWNMDAVTAISVLHGVSNWKSIIVVGGYIKNDDDTILFPISAGISPTDMTMRMAIQRVVSSSVDIIRLTGSGFDSTSFTNTSFNRGFIELSYEE